MRFVRDTLAIFACGALVVPQGAVAQRAQQTLPVPTWDVTGDEDDLFGDYGCLRWPDVEFPLTPGQNPDYIEDRRAASEIDDRDRISIRVDDRDRPIVDRFGNFIRCEVPPPAGWLNGTTFALIGALIVGQILIFAGGGGNSGNTNDSPG